MLEIDLICKFVIGFALGERDFQYSDKDIKNIKMNVWKYIYIQFFKIRRRIIGYDGADEYAAMLFVASLDCLFYWGIVTFFDGFTGYHLLPKHKPLYALIFLGGALIIGIIHNNIMCKKGVFERIKKEVEGEPRKLFWGIISLVFILFALSFFALSMYLWGKRLIPVLISF